MFDYSASRNWFRAQREFVAAVEMRVVVNQMGIFGRLAPCTVVWFDFESVNKLLLISLYGFRSACGTNANAMQIETSPNIVASCQT